MKVVKLNCWLVNNNEDIFFCFLLGEYSIDVSVEMFNEFLLVSDDYEVCCYGYIIVMFWRIGFKWSWFCIFGFENLFVF